MAGRIPQTFIDELLDRADIVDVIDSRVTLKKSGRNFMACCPFHDEKTPSFSVQPEKQFYYCFGCGASGNALGFLMEYERLDFRAAIEQLSSKYGLPIPEESREDEQQGRRKRDLYAAMEQSDEFYRQLLRTHPAGKGAVGYLKDRGLSAAIVQKFGVGLVPPGWDNLLKQFENDKQSLEMLLEAGMLIRRDAGAGKHRLYDRFRHRIMFPIRDSRGRTIAFGGRVMGDDKPKYLNSPETPIYQKSRELYGLYEARQANKHLEQILIVEGYMDVIALAQHGIDNAVATLGTSTSAVHLQRLFRHCEELVFCFDGDQAGAAAARRALDVCLPVIEDGQQLKFLFLPQGEDPDTLVRQEGSERFRERVANAQPLSEYLFAQAAAGLDTTNADGKAAMSQRALALINKLRTSAFKGILQSELATRTGLDKSTVELLSRDDEAEIMPDSLPAPADVYYDVEPIFSDAGAPDLPDDYDMAFSAAPVRRRPLRSQGPPEPMSLVEVAIGLLVYKPQLISQVDSVEFASNLHDDNADLLRQLLELLKRRPDSSTGMLLGYWYGQEEGEKLTELCGRGIELLREGMESLEQEGQAETAFEQSVEQRFIDTIERLGEQLHRHRLDELLLQIDQYQRQGTQAPGELRSELKALLAARSKT
ncbi:MAG: DNA primase [Pseudomonadota bacterium]